MQVVYLVGSPRTLEGEQGNKSELLNTGFDIKQIITVGNCDLILLDIPKTWIKLMAQSYPA